MTLHDYRQMNHQMPNSEVWGSYSLL
jgi:hypothetical protein